MANKVFDGIIRLRKDTEANFNLIKDSFIPANGEACLIECANGIRVKIGDGVKFLAQLDYIDNDLINQINSVVERGYYLNNKFYTDSTYLTVIPPALNKIFIDANSNVLYEYDGSSYHSVNDTLPTASDATAGVAKLYSNSGSNTDGSMTQKAITDGVNSIKFDIDENDSECLVLDLPWD